jgi:hypothetical protein
MDPSAPNARPGIFDLAQTGYDPTMDPRYSAPSPYVGGNYIQDYRGQPPISVADVPEIPQPTSAQMAGLGGYPPMSQPVPSHVIPGYRGAQPTYKTGPATEEPTNIPTPQSREDIFGYTPISRYDPLTSVHSPWTEGSPEAVPPEVTNTEPVPEEPSLYDKYLEPVIEGWEKLRQALPYITKTFPDMNPLRDQHYPVIKQKKRQSKTDEELAAEAAAAAAAANQPGGYLLGPANWIFPSQFGLVNSDYSGIGGVIPYT